MNNFYFMRIHLYISCRLEKFLFWRDYNDLVLLPSIRVGSTDSNPFISFEFLHLFISLDYLKNGKATHEV